jgi:hypothetical protein
LVLQREDSRCGAGMMLLTLMLFFFAIIIMSINPRRIIHDLSLTENISFLVKWLKSLKLSHIMKTHLSLFIEKQKNQVGQDASPGRWTSHPNHFGSHKSCPSDH